MSSRGGRRQDLQAESPPTKQAGGGGVVVPPLPPTCTISVAPVTASAQPVIVPTSASHSGNGSAAAVHPLPVAQLARSQNSHVAMPLASVPTRAARVSPEPAAAASPSAEASLGDWGRRLADLVSSVLIRAAPPWLVSLLVHLVLLIVLALWYLPEVVKSAFVLQVGDADQLGEQLLDDTKLLASPDPVEATPALAIDVAPAPDPLAAPPEIALDLFGQSTVKAPSIGLALTGRQKGSKRALLAAYGGTGETQEAVQLALEWLKRNQTRDGSWKLTGPYSDGVNGSENRVAATAMALLAFQGDGHTHLEGEFKEEVKKGVAALLSMQDSQGSFFATQNLPNHHQLYSQGQATIAVCELYGMTQDNRYREPAQRALDYAVSIQADDGQGGGGWRYDPGRDVDTSVTGWFVMALQSGKMAQLNVSSEALERVSKYLDHAAAEPSGNEQFLSGSRYGYRLRQRELRVSMTAEALLCRQYLGWSRSDSRLLAGVEFLGQHPIDWDNVNVYTWYYATQVMHHMGGEPWEKWNQVMRRVVPQAQLKTGRERGSWSPSGDPYAFQGGRLYTTCFCTYLLEVYYRHLPIYQHAGS